MAYELGGLCACVSCLLTNFDEQRRPHDFNRVLGEGEPATGYSRWRTSHGIGWF